MRVGVRSHGEISLANMCADSGPGLAAEVEQRDSPVPQVMWGERGDASGGAGARDRRPQPVGRKAEEDARWPDSIVSRDEVEHGAEQRLRNDDPARLAGLRDRLRDAPAAASLAAPLLP